VSIEHEELESDGSSESDDFEERTITSKHTGHLCSSFADVGEVSFADGVGDAKNGQSKLTPFSPRT
jgi:hypothetical protein